MRHLRKDWLIYLVILLGALVAYESKAATVAFSWSAPPAKCADNSTDVTKCPVRGYRVYAGAPGATKVLVQTITDPAVMTYSATTATSICLQVSAFNNAGESPLTSEVCKAVDSLAPSTPVNPVVASNIVYSVVKGKDRFVMIAVGRVPADTHCDATQCIGVGPIYCIVPSDAVQWAGTVRAQLVMAVCS